MMGLVALGYAFSDSNLLGKGLGMPPGSGNPLVNVKQFPSSSKLLCLGEAGLPPASDSCLTAAVVEAWPGHCEAPGKERSSPQQSPRVSGKRCSRVAERTVFQVSQQRAEPSSGCGCR